MGFSVEPSPYFIGAPVTDGHMSWERPPSAPMTGEGLRQTVCRSNAFLPEDKERPMHSQQEGICNGSWSWEEAGHSWAQ